MPDFKYILIAALLVGLFAVKWFAGNRPYDTPVRRRRRYGPGGVVTREQIKNAPAPDADATEKEFFGKDGLE